MGRLPKPAHVKDAQGNPGRRNVPRESDTAQQQPAHAIKLPFAKLKGSAKKAHELIGTELRRLNFVRPSDEPILLRYCKSLADFWDVTGKLDALGSQVYDCPMTNSEKTMVRVHPLFLVQERLAKRLESMEDRLGLSPMARQQYLLRMASAGAQGSFGLPAPQQNAKPSEAPAPRPGSPVGLLRTTTAPSTSTVN
jgi:P27 family predicted phage terminase small subunit